MKTNASIKDLKPNGFVLIDNDPCRVTRVTVSSSGKHGHSKVRLDAVGLLDGRNRSIIKTADETIDVPIVEKKKGQVLSIQGNVAQIMNLEDYSVFELDIPEERKGEIKSGEDIDYYTVMDMKTLKALK